MTVERLDRSRVDAIAYRTAETSAGPETVHPARPQRRYRLMTPATQALQPLAALIAGILILLVPRLLNYVVAVYLIVIGLIGLWPHLVYRLLY
jgi:hypothetical protein